MMNHNAVTEDMLKNLITKEDLKSISGISDTFLVSLTKLAAIVTAYQKSHKDDEKSHTRQTEALLGLIGIMKSHVGSLLQFLDDSEKPVKRLIGSMEKKSIINVGLPLTIEKLNPQTEFIKALVKEEKKDEEVKVCDDVLAGVHQLEEIVTELKKMPNIVDDSASSYTSRPNR
jgi:hypothetical protein